MADITGGSNADELVGTDDNDLIRGLNGNDTIDGGAGDDVIFGGFGTNVITGGTGNDTFGIEARGNATQIHDIQDFTIGEDKIDLSVLNIPDFDTLLPFMEQSLDDLIITFEYEDRTERFILRDVSFNDVSASDFIFNTDPADLIVTADGSSFDDYTLFGGNGNDTITGAFTGDDLIIAGSGDDVIDGGKGTNIITGGEGNDEFILSTRSNNSTFTTITDFEVGVDQFNVQALNVSTFADIQPFLTQDEDDVVFLTVFEDRSESYRFENVQLSALSAADFIFNTDTADLTVTTDGGSRFDDYVLFGAAGDDDITGADGNDTLIGGAGDDEIDGGFGTNILRGGAGNDDFNISSRGTSSTNTTIEDFTIGEDQLDVRIFNVADLTTLTPFLSQDGDDVVLSTVNADRSEIYRLVNVQLEDLTSDEFIFNDINRDITVNAVGSRFDDYTLFGGNGDDTITGSTDGNNTLNGGAGDDELIGGTRNDILIGGAGADELIGGDGFDRASYITASTAVNINLATGEVSGDQTTGDTFDSIEGIIGSQFDDVLIGSDGAGRFNGLDGDDIIVTGESADSNGNPNVVFGGNGNDTITGGSERDLLSGENGNDIIDGGEGNNEIDGGAGNDLINAGAGNDEILGGEGDDVINAGAGSNEIDGGTGDDIISIVFNINEFNSEVDGGEGSDTLVLDTGFAFIREAVGFGSADASFQFGRHLSLFSDSVFYSGTYDNIEHIQVEGITFDVDDEVINQNPFLNGESEQLFLTNESDVVQAEFVDNVFGLAGNDYIISNQFDQNLFGGAGSDYLVGNRGNDTLSGDTSFALSDLEGIVYRAYEAVLDRAPDIGGFNGNLQVLRLDTELRGNADDQLLLRNNASVDSITSGLVSSVEFQNIYGALDDRAFIEQIFLNVFDRAASETDANAFTASLAGRSRANVVVELANSQEFINLTTVSSAAFATNVIFNPVEGEVFRVYQATLGRAPDDAGFLTFTNSINAGVLTLNDVILEFIDSPEFIAAVGDNTLPNRDFIENLFTNVLPGNEDQAGRDAFTEALFAGDLTRAEVVEEFVNSPEFRNAQNLATLEFVRQVENGNSADILDGGSDDDLLIGGGGDDVFIYDLSDNDGQDVIADFVAGDAGGDVIRLFGTEDFDTFAEIMAVGSQEGADAFFNFGNGNSIRLNNVTLSALNEGDFDIIAEETDDGGTAKSSPDLYAVSETFDMDIFVEDFDAALLG